jgi:hypothetical protein
MRGTLEAAHSLLPLHWNQIIPTLSNRIAEPDIEIIRIGPDYYLVLRFSTPITNCGERKPGPPSAGNT